MTNPKIILNKGPGSGKTTVVKRVMNTIDLPAGGFYIEQIRTEGRRVGFRLVTLDGEINPQRLRSQFHRAWTP